MTREKLIKSDEYLIATVECIVVSRKSVRKMRHELNEFFLNWKAELLLYDQKQNSEPLPQLKQADVIRSVCKCGNQLTEKELFYETCLQCNDVVIAN